MDSFKPYIAPASSDKRKAAFLKAFETNACQAYITCRKTNTRRSTYYQWLRNDKNFAEAIDLARECTIDNAESKLQNQINKENMTAIIFFLKAKGGARGWNFENQPEIDPTELSNYNIESLTVEELKTFVSLLEKMENEK